MSNESKRDLISFIFFGHCKIHCLLKLLTNHTSLIPQIHNFHKIVYFVLNQFGIYSTRWSFKYFSLSHWMDLFLRR